mgnify:CR=1 FL=1
MTKGTAGKVVATRPAEIGGISGSIGLLIAKAAGVDDPDTIVAIGVVIGFIPALVTYIVNLVATLHGE